MALRELAAGKVRHVSVAHAAFERCGFRTPFRGDEWRNRGAGNGPRHWQRCRLPVAISFYIYTRLGFIWVVISACNKQVNEFKMSPSVSLKSINQDVPLGPLSKGRGTRDEGRGTRDEGRGTRDELSIVDCRLSMKRWHAMKRIFEVKSKIANQKSKMDSGWRFSPRLCASAGEKRKNIIFRAEAQRRGEGRKQREQDYGG